MSDKRSFFKCWLFVCWLPVAGVVLGVAVQAMRITGKPQQYISLAKLVAGGRLVHPGAAGATGFQYKEYLADFYGTIIETLESSEMRRRALDRVRALHPELKECDIYIEASQNKGSAIFSVRAFGSEPKYTRIILDALLDEFIAFRNQIREQQRNKALTSLAEDVVRREKGLKEKQDKLTNFEKENTSALLTGELNRLTQRALRLRDERDDLNRKKRDTPTAEGLEAQLASTLEELTRVEKEIEPLTAKVAIHDGLTKDYQEAKRGYDEILDLVRRFTVSDDMMSDHVTIMERASGAVEDLQEWSLPILVGAIGGAGAGLVISLLIAAIIYAASPRSAPPPLPPGDRIL